MRIRKNAKTSAANSNPSHNNQTTLCLLNQSPWDIITFPSTHHSSSTSIHLFDDFVNDYNVSVAANRSSADSGRAIQSVASTKNSSDCDYDTVVRNGNVDDNIIRDYESYQEEDKLGFMCEDTQNDAVWSTKKKAQSVSKSRGGSKKRAVTVTSKQNEFYYYSGFGPSWGKKRGEMGNKCSTFNACSTVVTTSGDVDDMDVEDNVKRVEPDTTMMRSVWSCWKGPKMDGFDYVEEDKHENGKQKEKTVKKRGRKPMKARSLKSLM